MKKPLKLKLLSVLLLMAFALNSCNKRDSGFTPEGKSTTITAEVKAFYSSKISGRPSKGGTKEKPGLLEPKWEGIYEIKGANGIDFVVVPAEGIELQKSNLSMFRLFVFEKGNHSVLSGRIIEVFGEKDYLTSKKDVIISQYDKKAVPGFTGYITTYDLNYRFAKGASFNGGKQSGVGRVAQTLNGQDLTTIANSLRSKDRIASSRGIMNEPDRMCQDWYWVVRDEDGDIVSVTYMYTICEGGTGGGGGNSGGGTGGGGGGPDTGDVTPEDPGEILYRVVTSSDSIKIAKRFECFDALPDQGATYSVKICADIPRNGQADALLSTTFEPGHAFLTLTKTVNGVSVTENIGFYPKNGITSIFNMPVQSMMVDNEAHEYDAMMTITVPEATFDNMLLTAVEESKKSYDLNDYNCTDFAIKVFNTGLGSNDKLLVSDTVGSSGLNYGTTPNGLYKQLKTKRDNNDSRVSVGTNNAPSSNKCQ